MTKGPISCGIIQNTNGIRTWIFTLLVFIIRASLIRSFKRDKQGLVNNPLYKLEFRRAVWGSKIKFKYSTEVTIY